MEKEKYVRAEMQITMFETEDVLTSSGSLAPPDLGDNDLEILG